MPQLRGNEPILGLNNTTILLGITIYNAKREPKIGSILQEKA
jgi:hypothetical protein